MNKKLITLLMASVLVLPCVALSACGGSQSSTDGTAAEETTEMTGQPPFQPVDHEGRWEAGGYETCLSCHGKNSQEGQGDAAAPATPGDHYQNGDASSQMLEGSRTQCTTCHPLSGADEE